MDAVKNFVGELLLHASADTGEVCDSAVVHERERATDKRVTIQVRDWQTSGGGSNVSKDAAAARHASHVDQVLIVTNPDMPSISEALKVIHIAKEYDKEVLGVVVNRVTRDKFDLERNNIEAFLEAKVIAEIPEDIKVKRSIAMKHPVVYTHPDAPSSVAFKKLAAKLMGQKYKPSLSEKPDKINKLLSRLGV